MARKQRPICSHIDDLDPGDILVWDNTAGTHRCVVTGCRPALECDAYVIPAGQTVDAKAVQTSRQTYHPDCCPHHHGDPRLIVR